MADRSRIEWTEATWNPVTGCDRISPGCDHCYALTLAARLKAMGQAKYQADGHPATSGPGFAVTVHPAAVTLPLRWRSPRMVFVTSMGDLFHDAVPDGFVAAVFAVMALARRHTFQLLTKRHARLQALLTRPAFATAVAEYATGLIGSRPWRRWQLDLADRTATPPPRGTMLGTPPWPLPNVHIGVSVETQRWADIRIPALLQTPAALRWVSAEPLLGPIDLDPFLRPDCLCPDANLETHYYIDHCPSHGADRRVLDWVVVGGESGPAARPCHPQWVRDLRDQCAAAQVAFFFKQWGGRSPKAGGRLLDGRTWERYPTAALGTPTTPEPSRS